MINRYLDSEEVYGILRHLLTSITTGVQAAQVGSDNTITFTMFDGTQTTMIFPTPVPGTKITAFEPDGANIVLTQDDGTSFTCPIPGAGIVDVIDATTTVGGVEEGTHYDKGESLEEIVRQILQGQTPPTAVAQFTTETEGIRDVTASGVSLGSVALNAKGEWGGKSGLVSLKGTYTWTPTYTTPTPFKPADTDVIIDETYSPAIESKEYLSLSKTIFPQAGLDPGVLTWKVEVEDEDGQTAMDSTSIEWILPKYFGIYEGVGSTEEQKTIDVDSKTISAMTAEIVKTGTKLVSKSKSYSNTNIVSDYGKIFYVYPKNLGNLTNILDGQNNTNLQEYDCADITIDGYEYLIYFLRIASGWSSDAPLTQKYT